MNIKVKVGHWICFHAMIGFLAIGAPLTFSSDPSGAPELIEVSFCGGSTEVPLSAHFANTPDLRSIGFQTNPSVDAILFAWPTAQIRSFWMRNTEIPLDLWHLDDHGVIQEVIKLTPYSETIHHSGQEGRYSLETRSHLRLTLEFGIGDRVVWQGDACASPHGL